MAKEETNQTPAFARKKLTVEYVDPKEMTGKSIHGRYLGKQTSPWTDKVTGEVKPLTRCLFEKLDPKTGKLMSDRMAIFEDAGFRKGMEDGLVQPGDCLEIVHLGKENIGQGRTVNQYDFFTLDIKGLPPVRALPAAAPQNDVI